MKVYTTTKSGIQIGCYYNPPIRNTMSEDDELIQRALLGIRQPQDFWTMLDWFTYSVLVSILMSVFISYFAVAGDA
jgi:hypothetical protein